MHFGSRFSHDQLLVEKFEIVKGGTSLCHVALLPLSALALAEVLQLLKPGFDLELRQVLLLVASIQGRIDGTQHRLLLRQATTNTWTK